MYGLYYCGGGINSFGTLQSHRDRIWLACFETISHRDRKTCCLSPAATVDDLGVSGMDESLARRYLTSSFNHERAFDEIILIDVLANGFECSIQIHTGLFGGTFEM